MRITIETPTLTGSALDALEADWRALEARCDCSFFQSWSWIGCRIASRFDRPRLVRAHRHADLVGIALFNRHALPFARRALWLHETGDSAEDSVFIEHNGPLIVGGRKSAMRAIIRAALRDAGGVVVLNGVGPDTRQAAESVARCHVRNIRPAPFAALAGTSPSGWRAGLGSSTRAQLKRSQHRLDAIGPVSWRIATDVDEAIADLDRLATLHQARWKQSGLPGAFTNPTFLQFHRDLIRCSFSRGEISIGHLSVGSRAICYLYDFRWRGSVIAYQSGIDRDAAANVSPGLLAHAHALEHAIRAGFTRYDFLAGESRHKRSLANESVDLAWIEAAGWWSIRGWPQTVLRWINDKRSHSK